MEKLLSSDVQGAGWSSFVLSLMERMVRLSVPLECDSPYIVSVDEHSRIAGCHRNGSNHRRPNSSDKAKLGIEISTISSCCDPSFVWAEERENIGESSYSYFKSFSPRCTTEQTIRSNHISVGKIADSTLSL